MRQLTGKIKVPEGMIEAARKAYLALHVFSGIGDKQATLLTSSTSDEAKMYCRRVLEAALRWQQQNPPKPSIEFVKAVLSTVPYPVALGSNTCEVAEEWIRYMYEDPQPEVPPEVDNLLWGEWQKQQGIPEQLNGWLPMESHNAQILEAFRRGKECGKR
jgi:hypothetical protein